MCGKEKEYIYRRPDDLPFFGPLVPIEESDGSMRCGSTSTSLNRQANPSLDVGTLLKGCARDSFAPRENKTGFFAASEIRRFNVVLWIACCKVKTGRSEMTKASDGNDYSWPVDAPSAVTRELIVGLRGRRQ